MRETTYVQSILFDKQQWILSKAKYWLKEHGYKYSKVDEKLNHLRFRQQNPSDFKSSSFRTINFGNGIKAIIGHLK